MGTMKEKQAVGVGVLARGAASKQNYKAERRSKEKLRKAQR